MKKIAIFLLITLSLWVSISARDIQALLNSKKIPPFEKLYVHVDREQYATGDIIWLKAYQVNGVTHQLNSNFRNIFVQLVADDGRVVKDLLLFSIKGQAHGEFRTDSLAGGIYTIRASTKYLENFGEEALFHKKIIIYKSISSFDQIEKVQTDSSKMDVSFLPEGGSLVLNVSNTVAFKAIDQKGRGINITGQIRNDRGDSITSFATSYLGMGKFILMPEDGVSYHATIDRYPELKIQLPPAKANGICLNYKAEGELLMFEISTSNNQENYPEFYFVASHKGTSLFHQKVEMVGNTRDIKVKKILFPNGISKITLLDTALNPLAERLIFVDQGSGDLLNLRLNEKEFKPREEVKLDVDALLDPGDSITSTMSVAVVNKNHLSTGENSQNIKSYLLLDSDLKGAIELPASYFVDDQFYTSAEKLDLLMLVHGWTNYLWDDVEQTPPPLLEDWNDAGINVSGYVKKLLWNSPVPEAVLAMDYVYRNFRIGTTTADKNGRFLFKQIYYLESLKVMLNAQTKNGSRNLDIRLDPLPEKDTLVSLSLLKSNCLDIDLNPDFVRKNSFRQMKELEFNPEEGTILLDGIDIVKNRDNSIFRSSGAYPWADKTLLITKDDYSFKNLLDYLRSKVPAFTDYGDEVMLKNKPVQFMIDGLDHKYSLKDIRNIQMREIEIIDIMDPGFRRGFALEELGAVDESGLIAIYKKATSDDMDSYAKGRLIPRIKGYTLSKKFYSPVYSLENLDSPKPDFRPTLYWNPELKFENGKANINFFTSDEVADYVVVVEGITKNGKICFGTASFTVDKKQ
jgi:hypothetical protein